MSIIIPANSAAGGGGFSVANSCMFNSADTASLSKTPSSNGSNTVWTVSMWVKRAGTAAGKLHAAGTSSTYEFLFDDTNFGLTLYNGSATIFVTSRSLKDSSSWYHIVLAYNTGASGTDKVKLFINGVQETSFATDNRSSAGTMNHINQNVVQYVGRTHAGGPFNGYLAEVCIIDGTAYAASDFGEFDEDSGIWVPKDVSGLTFGTNGFYLDFKVSGNLGNDANGGTDLTENNIAATDQATDTCTNNFATVSSATPATGNLTYLRSGNLELKQNNNPYAWPTTLVATTGKWYWEQKVSALGTTAVGVLKQDKFPQNGSLFYPFVQATGFAYKNTGNKGNNNNDSSYGASYTNDDILSVAFDQTNGTIWFAKNGAWQNSATKTEIENGTTTNSAFSSMSTNGEFYGPFIYTDGSTVVFSNFGNPFFAISSGNSDGNDFGNFEYEVPTGYFSLCSKNLAEFG